MNRFQALYNDFLFRSEEYCDGCQTSLKGVKRRFTCSSCSAVYHPSCAVSAPSKWSKADISRWKCENCAYDEMPTPTVVDNESICSSSRQKSSVYNDSDAGSETGHISLMDRRESSTRASAVVKDGILSTRTGRVVKRPKSFDDVDSDPSR